MRFITIAGSIAGLLFMTACTPTSLEPFYTEKSMVRGSKLTGMWQNRSSEAVIQFTALEGAYECTYAPRDDSAAHFKAALFEIGGHHYLDLYPLDAVQSNALSEMAHIPAHILFRIVIEDSHLRMALLDSDWLADTLTEDCDLDYVETAKGLVLTGPSDQIQDFLARHGDDPGAFLYWSEWVLMSAPSLSANTISAILSK